MGAVIAMKFCNYGCLNYRRSLGEALIIDGLQFSISKSLEMENLSVSIFRNANVFRNGSCFEEASHIQGFHIDEVALIIDGPCGSSVLNYRRFIKIFLFWAPALIERITVRSSKIAGAAMFDHAISAQWNCLCHLSQCCYLGLP